MADQIQITILEDGTIKAETDRISAANHQTAEAFMRNLAVAGGGEQKRQHKGGLLGEAAHTLAHALGKAHQH